MNRRLLLGLLAALLGNGGDERPPRTSLAQSLLSVAEDAGLEGREADSGGSLAELERIAALVRQASEQQPERPPVDVLNETIFGKLGFVREVEDRNLGFVYLASVLRHRRGSCVGLGTLYLALATRLGWQAEGVMVPGHFFVRIREHGRLRNVELLRHGEEMPDSWYETRFSIPGGSAPEYGRALTFSEVLAIVDYDIGKERQRQGRLAEARLAYERATRLFPAFAEAEASLGATLHLTGDLDEARRHYETARRANPHLPGVDWNIELLEREQSLVRQER